MSDETRSPPMPHLDSLSLSMLQRLGGLLDDVQIHELSVEEERAIFREAQSPAADNPGVSVTELNVSTDYGDVKTFIYRPKDLRGDLPFLYFIHGGGWIIGTAFKWARFLYQLNRETGVAIVFPEYSLAPEKQFPVQHEQCIGVLKHVLRDGRSHGLKCDKTAIVADSGGASMALALSLLNMERYLELPIIHQILLHPVVNTSENFATYLQWQFRHGPMSSTGWTEMFFNAYFLKAEDRASLLGSPGLMTEEQARQSIPSTTIVTSEIDCWRDQDLEFAKLLQTAGVSCGVVQAMSVVHDCEVFNGARDSPTAQLVMAMIFAKIRDVLAKDGLPRQEIV